MGLDQSVMVNPAQEVKFPEDTKDGPCKYPLSIETAEKESREADGPRKYELSIEEAVVDRKSPRKDDLPKYELSIEEAVVDRKSPRKDGPRKNELRIEEAVAARPKYPLTIGADDADSERYPGVIVPAKEESRKAVTVAPGEIVVKKDDASKPADGDGEDESFLSKWVKYFEDLLSAKQATLTALYAKDVKVLKAKYTKDVELLAHHVKKQGQQIKDLHEKLADIQVLPFGPRPK